MEPSTNVDGDLLKVGNTLSKVLASMEPSTNVDGDRRLGETPGFIIVASMEPSTNVDGDDRGLIDDVMEFPALQWSRRRTSTETARSARGFLGSSRFNG